MERTGWYVAAFTTGAVVMAAELGASRLIAPFFGTSTPVWALLIGAVLLSLAVGQAIGGRLSRRSDAARWLVPLLLGSSVLLFILPFVAPPLMEGSLALFRRGSLAMLASTGIGVTTLVALPLLVVGATGPLLIDRLAAASREPVGAVAGRVYALSTLGSLLGTYAAGLVLIPALGTSRSLWLGAGALAVVAGLVGHATRLGRTGLAAGLVGVALVAIVDPPAVKSRRNAIFETESSDNYIQVTDDGVRRALYLNDGYAVQSVFYRDGRLPLEGVWGYYALAPAWTASRRPDRFLLLGLGGGTSARTLRLLFPHATITGVERDARVVEAGRRFFDLPDDVRVIVEDGRSFVRREASRYDVIIVDAFQFPYVPFQMCTVEFFQEVAARLAPGGALVLNVGRDGDARALVHAVGRAAHEVFPYLRSADVLASNTIVVATRHAADRDSGLGALGLSSSDAARLAALEPPTTFEPDPSFPLLSDDRAPVELLTDRVLLGRVTDTGRRPSKEPVR